MKRIISNSLYYTFRGMFRTASLEKVLGLESHITFDDAIHATSYFLFDNDVPVAELTFSSPDLTNIKIDGEGITGTILREGTVNFKGHNVQSMLHIKRDGYYEFMIGLGEDNVPVSYFSTSIGDESDFNNHSFCGHGGIDEAIQRIKGDLDLTK